MPRLPSDDSSRSSSASVAIRIFLLVVCRYSHYTTAVFRADVTEPEMVRLLLDRKRANLKATGASIIATGNPGCLAWIQQGAKEQGIHVRICHPVELLDEAYVP